MEVLIGMAKKIYWENPKDRELITKLLKKDEIIVSSTDTIYGFLGDTTQKAWQNICDLKEVAQKRPFLILISQEDILEKVSHFADLSELPEKTIKFIKSCWPGPVTFIFKTKSGLPEFLSSDTETVALRCPDHAGLQEILKDFNGLFSTSANKSAEPAPIKYSDISPDILEKIKYIICDAQESQQVTSSTLVNLTSLECDKELPFEVIREGAFSVEKLQDIYSKL